MVLWSLALNSTNLDAFRQASHWAVHILAAGQESLSIQFATRESDRFHGRPHHPGPRRHSAARRLRRPLHLPRRLRIRRRRPRHLPRSRRSLRTIQPHPPGLPPGPLRRCIPRHHHPILRRQPRHPRRPRPGRTRGRPPPPHPGRPHHRRRPRIPGRNHSHHPRSPPPCATCCRAWGDRAKQARKAFFFEKKKQKAFVPCCHAQAGCRLAWSPPTPATKRATPPQTSGRKAVMVSQLAVICEHRSGVASWGHEHRSTADCRQMATRTAFQRAPERSGLSGP